MIGIDIPVLVDGTVHGIFLDPHGVDVDFVLRAADGTIDLFRVDLDVKYNHYEFRTVLEHSDDLGTRYYQLLMRAPDSVDFKNLMAPAKFNTAAIATRYIIDRDLAHIAREVLIYIFKTRFGEDVDLASCSFVEGKLVR